MIPITCFGDRPVAVFGLGGSGLATALALVAGGARPIVWDDGEAGRKTAAERGLAVQNLAEIDWASMAALVLSPGVPLTHPEPHWTVKLAARHGVELIGDIELFVRQRRLQAPGAPFVAITGTNGKSTTTALIAHLFAAAGHDVQLGGNIGTAILSLEPPAPDRVHVVECSSYQIDLAPSIDPSVAILLNVTEDHLDRHGTIEHYAAVKARLVDGAETAIVGADDSWSADIADDIGRRGHKLVRISVERALSDGVYAVGDRIYSAEAGRAVEVASLAGIGSLRGAHNAQNACAALAAARAQGLSLSEIQSGMRSFPGLAHRMEQVGRLGSTLFVNDSKATNADAAAKALSSFDTIFWIAGGKPKTGGIAPLADYFPKIRKAYLIGEATEEFAATLEGQVPFVRAGTIEKAVPLAAADAAASGLAESVVLLSPACASFDQFRNFEERGKTFSAAVLGLPGIRPFTGQ
jgi:UDP-N-acetylmuramoylalanine--D-glutamate ligase